MDEVVRQAVDRAIATMHANLGERLTIDDIARSAMFSKFHFSRLFQKVTGMSPGRYLSAMRLEEAKRLLVTTSLTVADISHRVGYNSIGTFSSRFKGNVGVSPTTYRQLGGNVPGATNDSPVRDWQSRHLDEVKSTIRGHIVAPSAGQIGLVFVGLFPTPVPEAPAIRCTVLHRPGPYTIKDVPLGTWYLMAHGVAPGTERRMDNAPYVGSHGAITIQPGAVAWLADVRLERMERLDHRTLSALLDIRSAGLSSLAS